MLYLRLASAPSVGTLRSYFCYLPAFIMSRHNLTDLLADELIALTLNLLETRDLFSCAGTSKRLRGVAQSLDGYVFRCRLQSNIAFGLRFAQLSEKFLERLAKLGGARLPLKIDVFVTHHGRDWVPLGDRDSQVPRNGIYNNSNLHDIIKEIMHNMDYVVELLLTLPANAGTVLEPILRTAAPRLRYLFIDLDEAHRSAVDPQLSLCTSLFSGTAPRLQRVNLRSVQLPANSIPAFARVSSLVVHDPHFFALERISTNFPSARNFRLGTHSQLLTLPPYPPPLWSSLRSITIDDCTQCVLVKTELELDNLASNIRSLAGPGVNVVTVFLSRISSLDPTEGEQAGSAPSLVSEFLGLSSLALSVSIAPPNDTGTLSSLLSLSCVEVSSADDADEPTVLTISRPPQHSGQPGCKCLQGMLGGVFSRVVRLTIPFTSVDGMQCVSFAKLPSITDFRVDLTRADGRDALGYWDSINMREAIEDSRADNNEHEVWAPVGAPPDGKARRLVLFSDWDVVEVPAKYPTYVAVQLGLFSRQMRIPFEMRNVQLEAEDD